MVMCIERGRRITPTSSKRGYSSSRRRRRRRRRRKKEEEEKEEGRRGEGRRKKSRQVFECKRKVMMGYQEVPSELVSKAGPKRS
jgi:hypothetical protein